MIELPTPETDALFLRNGYPIEVDSSKAMQLCEKLEQERDWITEKFELLEGCFKRAERERDEAREKAERYRLEANAMMLQRDEAQNKLRLGNLTIISQKEEIELLRQKLIEARNK